MMKPLVAVCTLSALTLVVLVALLIDHFGRPFLGLAGAAPLLAFAALAINVGVVVVAFCYRRRGPALAWTALALGLPQLAVVLVLP